MKLYTAKSKQKQFCLINTESSSWKFPNISRNILDIHRQGSAHDVPFVQKNQQKAKKNPYKWAQGHAKFFLPKDDEIRLPQRIVGFLA